MTLLRPLLLALSLVSLTGATTRSVGPSKPYAKPCQAFAAASDGDVIEIDAAGNYNGDVCPITRNNLTIRGVNGRARIDASGQYAWGKGIWVVTGNNTLIENIEFSGAKVPDRNGAGIRLDGGNLTVRNCYFHDNENGILGGAYGTVTVEHSEFFHNGYGDGYSHNMYIGSGVAEFTLRYCWSHEAKVGHLVKSRASANYILYNRLSQENGTGSYELDLPNAGLAYVIGNILQQGNTTENRGMLAYGMEGVRSNVANQLFAVNNTFVSTRSAGATFVQIGSGVTVPAVIRSNIFSGTGTLTTQSGALLAGNVSSGDMGFLNASQYDYRITSLSAALNAGVEPGLGGGYPLRPAMQYHHPLCADARSDVGPIDAGAYEYGVIPANPVCAGGAAPAPAPNPVPPTPPAPAPTLTALTLGQTQVTGGVAAQATVSLSAAAPSSGAVVVLTSSVPAVAGVPASVTIPAGQASATFTIQTKTVSAPTPATISATYGGKTLAAGLTVGPPPSQVQIVGLGLSPATVAPGGVFRVRVQLSGPAPAGGLTVTLAASSNGVALPSQARISAGGWTGTVAGVVLRTATPQTVTVRVKASNEMATYLKIVNP